jgi:hypothetical protein
MKRLVAAIDPGSAGGMAWVDLEGEICTCPMDKRALFIEHLAMVAGTAPTNPGIEMIDVYMEKVSGYYPKPKTVPDAGKPEFNLQASAFSMFNFGKSAGLCYGLLEAFGMVPKEVMPATWQKICFVKKSGSRGQWKNKLKEIAQKRFPNVKVTLANADALLILSYGMLTSERLL